MMTLSKLYITSKMETQNCVCQNSTDALDIFYCLRLFPLTLCICGEGTLMSVHAVAVVRDKHNPADPFSARRQG